MFRYKETVLPFNRTLSNSLKKIYGIGFERAIYITSLFGFSSRYSINRINYFHYECIVALMKYGYFLEDRLKFGIKNRFSLYRDIGLIRVKRYDSGLPGRGQRTHSNARSPKMNKLF